jgi:hypothetical protein
MSRDPRAAIEEMHRNAPQVDRAGFDELVRRMVDRTRDPELLERLWDYREGKLDRVGLLRLPAFAAERTRWYDEVKADLRR